MNLFGNYSDHPSDKRYTVFKFYFDEQAEHFKKLLIINSIWFEEDTDDNELKYLHLFAIKNKDFKAVIRLNYEVIGKFRKPFISNNYFRYLVLVISLTAMILAVIGYVKS